MLCRACWERFYFAISASIHEPLERWQRRHILAPRAVLAPSGCPGPPRAVLPLLKLLWVSSFSPQLTRMNVEAQRVERELRDELADGISKAVSDADRARITELEKAEAQLRIENSK